MNIANQMNQSPIISVLLLEKLPETSSCLYGFVRHTKSQYRDNRMFVRVTGLDTSYKNLQTKIRSMDIFKDIFKELTFKETSTTTTNFRHKDFNYI